MIKLDKNLYYSMSDGKFYTLFGNAYIKVVETERCRRLLKAKMKKHRR